MLKILSAVCFVIAFYSTHAVGALIESLDCRGSTMITNFGNRIVDDAMAAAIRAPQPKSVSWLCGRLKEEQYAGLKELDLSSNAIADEGAQILGDFFTANGLPALELLDLSYNRISEQGIAYLAPLLKRNRFAHLIIYGNNGAATKEGITRLSDALTEGLNITQFNIIPEYLKKVIWVNKDSVNDAEQKGELPAYYAKVHRRYYGLR